MGTLRQQPTRPDPGPAENVADTVDGESGPSAAGADFPAASGALMPPAMSATIPPAAGPSSPSSTRAPAPSDLGATGPTTSTVSIQPSAGPSNSQITSKRRHSKGNDDTGPVAKKAKLAKTDQLPQREDGRSPRPGGTAQQSTTKAASRDRNTSGDLVASAGAGDPQSSALEDSADSALQTRVNEQGRQLNRLQRHIKRLEGRVKELTDERDSLKFDVDDLLARMDRMEREGNILQRRVEELAENVPQVRRTRGRTRRDA